MNKEIALKSLREKFSEVSNEMVYEYNWEKTQNTFPQRNQLKMSDLTLKDYKKMVHFSLVEVVLAEEALEEARYKRGFLGTSVHMFIARKLLLAKLHVEALRLAMARSEFQQPKETVSSSNVNGRITAHHIKIDTAPLNYVATPHFCYVMVVENDVKIVAPRPIKPDRQGMVVFPDCMVFDQQTCDFQLRISLYKLSLVKPQVQSWTKKIKKLWQGVEIPQFELIGYRTINLTNINRKVFRFSDATLYMQLQITVGTGVGPMRTPLAVGSLIQNTFFYGGRLTVLENTDLKLYTAADLQAGKIDWVFSLFDCHTCDIYQNSSEILKLTTVNNRVELFVYFPDKMAQILWQNAFNFAISSGNRWKKAL